MDVALPRLPGLPRLVDLALLALALASTAALGGCASSATKRQSYVLVYLVRGERTAEYNDAERAAIQERHLARIRGLVDEGALLVAGPFGKENHDPSVRGLFIFDVATISEAERLTSTDPAVEAGVLAMRPHRFETSADLRAAVAADLAAESEAKSAGRELRMQDRIRAYGLLRTSDFAAVAAAERALPPGDRAIITAIVDGRKGFCVVRTDELPRLRARLAEVAESLGDYTLDEWWASAYLDRAADQDPSH